MCLLITYRICGLHKEASNLKPITEVTDKNIGDWTNEKTKEMDVGSELSINFFRPIETSEYNLLKEYGFIGKHNWKEEARKEGCLEILSGVGFSRNHIEAMYEFLDEYCEIDVEGSIFYINSLGEYKVYPIYDDDDDNEEDGEDVLLDAQLKVKRIVKSFGSKCLYYNIQVKGKSFLYKIIGSKRKPEFVIYDKKDHVSKESIAKELKRCNKHIKKGNKNV